MRNRIPTAEVVISLDSLSRLGRAYVEEYPHAAQRVALLIERAARADEWAVLATVVRDFVNGHVVREHGAELRMRVAVKAGVSYVKRAGIKHAPENRVAAVIVEEVFAVLGARVRHDIVAASGKRTARGWRNVALWPAAAVADLLVDENGKG